MSKEIVLFPSSQYRPTQEKSVFRKFIDTASFGLVPRAEGMASDAIGKNRVATVLETFREYAEGGVASYGLGYLHGSGNMNVFGAPVDGVLALAGFAGRAIAGADSGIGKTMGDFGNAGNNSYFFRMGALAGKASKKSRISGDYDPDDSSDMGADPVEEAAKELD
jgi:hypothetical protein